MFNTQWLKYMFYKNHLCGTLFGA